MMKTIETSGAPSNPRPVNAPVIVALIGNPNCGKTTLFNALTGMRQKVGNYPGVTVEKKEGRARLADGTEAILLDLPGLYSLNPNSPDEAIAREVLMGLREETPRPDIVLNVVDASNLERNLYMTSQLLDIGLPMVIVLSMTDTLQAQGLQVDAEEMERAIGVPVRSVVASQGKGLSELRASLQRSAHQPSPPPVWKLSETANNDIQDLQHTLEKERNLTERLAFAEAVSLMMQDEPAAARYLPPDIREAVRDSQSKLDADHVDFPVQTVEARYAWVNVICKAALKPIDHPVRKPWLNDQRLDRIFMHPFWGYVLFVLVMTIVFQSIFSWVQAPMDLIKDGMNHLADLVSNHLPPGALRDMIAGGVMGGVGNTLVFLPQILLLFFFISLLEDTGYMARAAYLMDRLMSRVGLHGKSFIPLLSSFACAIPGIMATRTIGDRKARLITVLVAPLMSCSARLPVYTLMIGAFIPNRPVLRIGSITLLTLPGVTLLSMYFLGMAAAFVIAWLFHRTFLKGVAPSFLMELPPYRLPSLRTALMQMFERAALFLKRAGTIILAVSVVLWFLASYPKHPGADKPTQLAGSYLGMGGRLLEPAIAPLGFDWKMGVGIVSSFAAREVFVTAMGTIYNVDGAEENNLDLRARLREDVDPRTGKHVFTPLIAVCLMVYYVLAMQCMSTVAVVRRETNGWGWALFQIAYMTGLAWVVTFIVFRAGLFLHWGTG